MKNAARTLRLSNRLQRVCYMPGTYPLKMGAAVVDCLLRISYESLRFESRLLSGLTPLLLAVEFFLMGDASCDQSKGSTLDSGCQRHGLFTLIIANSNLSCDSHLISNSNLSSDSTFKLTLYASLSSHANLNSNSNVSSRFAATAVLTFGLRVCSNASFFLAACSSHVVYRGYFLALSLRNTQM